MALISPDAAERLRVLVVDDKVTMRKIVRRMLTNLGVCEIHTAEDGVQAIEVARKTRPHAVILDWEMPYLNGIEAVEHLRPLYEEQSLLPIIMMTASHDPKRMAEAAAAGILFTLIKPFSDVILGHRLDVIAKMQRYDDAMAKAAARNTQTPALRAAQKAVTLGAKPVASVPAPKAESPLDVFEV